MKDRLAISIFGTILLMEPVKLSVAVKAFKNKARVLKLPVNESTAVRALLKKELVTIFPVNDSTEFSPVLIVLVVLPLKEREAPNPVRVTLTIPPEKLRAPEMALRNNCPPVERNPV